MTGAAPAIRVIGSQFSPESSRIREFLVRTRVPHEWLDADHDPQVDSSARAVRHRRDGVAGRHRHWHRAAPGHPGRCGRLSRAHGREPAAALLRPGRRRGRSSRSGGGRLRSVRRAAHARPGDDGTRRAGRDELADRELPGVSHGRLRCGAHPAGDHPSREVRGQPHRALHRRLARKPCRVSGGATERWKRSRRTGRHRRDRCLLPPTGCLTAGRLRRQRRVLRRHRHGGTDVRRIARRGCRRWQLGWPSGHLSEAGWVRGHARHPRPGSRKGHVALSDRTNRSRPPHHGSDPHDRRRSGRGRDPASRASQWPRRHRLSSHALDCSPS